eukprot:scaffold45238_cov64-Phaeocystis_antarctica.AAC.3
MIRPWIRPRLAQSSTSAVSSYKSRDESRSVSPDRAVEVLELVRQTKRPESRETDLLTELRTPTELTDSYCVARWESARYSPFFSSSGPRRATSDARDPHVDREILKS